MSQSRMRSVGERKARVDILPLIDVMFLLLCFFVYITMMMVMQKGIFVNLATARMGVQTETEKTTLTLSLDRDGRIFLDKEGIELDQLPVRLQQLKPQDPILIVNADKEVPHGRVIQVLDKIRGVGLSEVIFAVEPQP